MCLEVWAQEVFRTLSPLKSELMKDGERDTQRKVKK